MYHNIQCYIMTINHLPSATACNDANAIPTRSRYAGTYAAAIAGRYGWEGLGGQGMGCEWLAGLVWEGLGGLGMGCEWLAGLVFRYTWTGGAGRSGAGL